MIAIIAAMQEEMYFLLEELEGKVEKRIHNFTFYLGNYFNHKIILARSGIGKVAASHLLTILLDHFEIDLVINTGTAGGYENDLSLYDIVIANKCGYHDVDITAFNYQFGQMAGCPPFFNTCEEILNLIKKLNSFHIGAILSGDQFISSFNEASFKVENYFSNDNVLAFDMESTAIAHLCYLREKKFMIIRIISDVLNFKGDKEDFSKIAVKCGMIAKKNILDFLKIYE